MKVKRSLNQTVVKENERFIIVKLEDDGGRRIVESQYNIERADRAVERLCEEAGVSVHGCEYEVHHIDTIEMIAG